MAKELDVSRVRDLFDYDIAAGVLIWRRRDRLTFVCDGAFKMWNTRYAGTAAGSVGPLGYVGVRIGGAVYSAHRLTWAHVHGAWPAGELDHVNGNPNDNRISNLRECSHAENHQNRGVAANNASGLTGVGWHKLRQKWRADIKVNGKPRALGLFDTKEQAHEAYLAAKQINHSFQPVPRAA